MAILQANQQFDVHGSVHLDPQLTVVTEIDWATAEHQSESVVPVAEKGCRVFVYVPLPVSTVTTHNQM